MSSLFGEVAQLICNDRIVAERKFIEGGGLGDALFGPSCCYVVCHRGRCWVKSMQ